LGYYLAMLRISRTKCLLLAVLLAGNTLLLAGHITMHGATGVEQCVLCASHVNPHSAAPAPMLWVATANHQPIVDEPPVAAQPYSAPLHRPHPRGPPAAA